MKIWLMTVLILVSLPVAILLTTYPGCQREMRAAQDRISVGVQYSGGVNRLTGDP